MEHILVDEILGEFRRRVFAESIVRIKKCLNILNEEQIWQRPAKEIPSVGNLVLHLCGNGKQWILSGLGKKEDTRKRDAEFAAEGGYSKQQLISLLDGFKAESDDFLTSIDAGELMLLHKVQVFEETGASILIHVIEHFSYHTGQITLITRLYTGERTEYYAGVNLN